MQSKQALEPQPRAAGPVFVETEKLMEQVKDLFQAIAKRAYEFFDGRGRAIGDELSDWFRAESELTRFVPMEVTEKDDQVVIRAEVPGFSPEEIKVSVEPNRVIICGRSEQKEEETNENKYFSEFRARQFTRTLGLPAEVEPEKATAKLTNGMLELTIAKSTANKAVEVDVKAS